MTWKTISNYDNYSVNELGVIKNTKTNTVKKQTLTNDGYYRVSLFNNKGSKTFYVHRLVALTFIDNIDNYPVVNHKDGCKTNNIVDNLEWLSHSQNIRHSYNIGSSKARKSSKLSDKDIIEIYFSEGSYKKIANHFKVSITTVSDIKNRKKYRYCLNESYLCNIPFEYSLLKEIDLSNNKDSTIFNCDDSFVCVNGYENYLINKNGYIYSKYVNRLLNPNKNKNGYLYVTLTNNERKTFFVHRLVMETFSNDKNNKSIINHKNNKRDDNRLSNLEWVSYSENNNHMVVSDNNIDISGNKNPMSKLTEKEVIEIYLSDEKASNLSKKYNVAIRQIYRIKNKERWSNILDKIVK